MGPAWARSSALPWGRPSITSTSTTSPNSFSTTYWATEAPTLPAPTTLILGRRLMTLSTSALPTCMRAPLQLRHGLDDGRPELRALHLPRALHEAREVVGDHLGLDRLLQPGDDPVRRIGPSQVAQHHLAREDDRARVDLVLTRVFGCGAVRRLEQRVPGLVVDVRAGRDADPAHLRRQGVRHEIAREVGGRDDVELVGPGEDLLEEGVGDRVLDEDPARRGPAPALVPRHGPVAELALGQRVAPLHEHPFRVLLDVPLVDERHALAAVLDGVADGGDLHLLPEEVHHLPALGRPLRPLDAGVDVLGVLAEDHFFF